MFIADLIEKVLHRTDPGEFRNTPGTNYDKDHPYKGFAENMFFDYLGAGVNLFLHKDALCRYFYTEFGVWPDPKKVSRIMDQLKGFNKCWSMS